MYYANQRHITVNRENVVSSKSTGRLYLIAYHDNIKDALKDLSASAFKCYLVMLMSKDKFVLDYSPEYFSSVACCHKDTARRALKELQAKGYLIQRDEKHFDFYEYPRSYNLNRPIQAEEKRQIIDQSTGEVFYYTYNELRQFVDIETANRLWQEAKKYDL